MTTPVKKWRSRLAAAALLPCMLLMAGCHLDMWNQPKYGPLDESEFFDDQTSARPLVIGTVPFQSPRLDNPLYRTVDSEGEFVREFPMEVTAEVLARGRERFNIFCSVCHDRTGSGNGMIIQRGDWERVPTSFHDERLKNMAPGYFVDVMTNGFGLMYSYASRVPIEDRWAIAAYIRALQLSQDMPIEQVPQEVRSELTKPDVSMVMAETASAGADSGEAHDEESHATY
jgi:hypothetical protein